jgi:biofilm protein TabA
LRLVSQLASATAARWIEKVMALFGSLSAIRAQASPATADFSAAWAYLDELVRSGSPVQQRVRALVAGDSQKHELTGGTFVIEQAYETRPRAEGFFESHRKLIDVQVIFAGDEVIEVIDLARATVRETYNPTRDLIVYADAPSATPVCLGANEAAVFWPADVHMPGLRAGSAATLVRKCVLKVPVL